MTATFLPSKYVPAGFEMLIKNHEVKSWGLWWNIYLNDDPAQWDGEVCGLNDMQEQLGDLSENQRLVRAHMAEFCRRQPLFPESMAILCREVGQGALENAFPSGPALLGCEGRGLLQSLGHHASQDLAEEWRDSLKSYRHALAAWHEGTPPVTPMQKRVSAFLGPQNPEIAARLQGVVGALEDETITRIALRATCRQGCIGLRGPRLLEGAPHPFYCVDCDDWATDVPSCGCAPARLLDAALLAAGPWDEREEMSGLFQHFIQEYVLAYALAINAWLEDKAWDGEVWPVEVRFVSRDEAATIAKDLCSWLGDRDRATEWLAGCLLKTVSDNQRWREGRELIDDVPQATSWLRS
ncbi:MAG: hypothetical protein ACLFV5_05210 [Anaerolineales bacterium]